jgi:hypothetical protein
VDGFAGRGGKFFSQTCEIGAELILEAANHLGVLANGSKESAKTSCVWWIEEDKTLEKLLLFFAAVFTASNG